MVRRTVCFVQYWFCQLRILDSEEAQNGCVQIDDIDPDVLQEMLHFIYSGRAPNIREMAPDLLAVADRFALPGLKEMADQAYF